MGRCIRAFLLAVAALGVLAGPAAAYLNQWRESNVTLAELIRSGYELKSAFQDTSKEPQVSIYSYYLQKGPSLFTCAEYVYWTNSAQTGVAEVRYSCQELVPPFEQR